MHDLVCRLLARKRSGKLLNNKEHASVTLSSLRRMHSSVLYFKNEVPVASPPILKCR
jgi:hypothetical protein